MNFSTYGNDGNFNTAPPATEMSVSYLTPGHVIRVIAGWLGACPNEPDNPKRGEDLSRISLRRHTRHREKSAATRWTENALGQSGQVGADSGGFGLKNEKPKQECASWDRFQCFLAIRR